MLGRIAAIIAAVAWIERSDCRANVGDMLPIYEYRSGDQTDRSGRASGTARGMNRRRVSRAGED